MGKATADRDASQADYTKKQNLAEDVAHAASAAAASDKLDTDSLAYDSALSTHTDTAGKLQSAIILVEANTATRDSAQTAKDAASRQAFLSDIDADDAEAFHASEVTRVASEDATLKEFDELLRNLLPEEF